MPAKPHGDGRARNTMAKTARGLVRRTSRRQLERRIIMAALVALLVPAAGATQQSGKPEKTAALLAAIAEVEAGRRTTPLVGEKGASGFTVTFLARRGGGPIPRIVSDVTGWGERPDDTFDFKAGTMKRVARTDWYFLETTVAAGARIEYLVARGVRDYGPDPYNPRRTAIRGTSPASEFVTPGYLPPREFEDPPVAPGGRVEELTIESRALGGPRSVIVYTPPGYRDNGGYPVVVFHGGLHVASTGVGGRVLDWLIARQAIEPLVAVFADSWPQDNHGDAASRLRSFVSGEILEWMASRWSVTADADKRAVLAVSYGAKDALDVAVRAHAFGRVGLLIPGRRMTRTDITALASVRGPHLHVAILAGLYDGPNLATARRARQALTAAGHTVDYIEVPEGHNQGTWRNHLRDVLVSLFGTKRESGSRNQAE